MSHSEGKSGDPFHMMVEESGMRGLGSVRCPVEKSDARALSNALLSVYVPHRCHAALAAG